jgi:large subunit ribosomal protein L19e
MAFLRLQKRLAASVLKCGKRRVWIDPNETSEVKLANSRKSTKTVQLPPKPSPLPLQRVGVNWCVARSPLIAKLNYKLTIGKNIRKLYKDGLIMRRQVTMHSRYRTKLHHAAQRKGKYFILRLSKGIADSSQPYVNRSPSRPW